MTYNYNSRYIEKCDNLDKLANKKAQEYWFGDRMTKPETIIKGVLLGTFGNHSTIAPPVSNRQKNYNSNVPFRVNTQRTLDHQKWRFGNPFMGVGGFVSQQNGTYTENFNRSPTMTGISSSFISTPKKSRELLNSNKQDQYSESLINYNFSDSTR
jgi:hypothetical protein